MRIPGIRRLLRVDRGASGVRRAIDDELRFHFDMTVEQLVASGLSVDAARAEAERRFGDIDAARRTLESIDRRHVATRRSFDLVGAIRQDARATLRGLRNNPGFTAVVVATFALGIGANAAMFGVVDRLLLRAPALIDAPDRVVRIYFARPAAGMTATVAQNATMPSLVALRERAAGFSDVAVYDPINRVLGQGETARQIHALSATANFFSLLGVHPALGRFYTAAEDALPAGSPVAVLSYEFWQSAFGEQPSALGKTLVVDNVRYTVIGVAPRGFTGVDLDPVDVILPLSAASIGDDPQWYTAKYMTWAKGIARLAPGVSVAAAQAEAARVLAANAQELGGMDVVSKIKLGPIPRALGPETGEAKSRGRVALWVTGVSVVLLMIACANVANLMLARAMRRRREIGIRLALGAGRGRIATSLIVESLMLAIAGGAVGLFVAWIGGRAMQTALLPDTATERAWFDPHVATVAAIAIVVTGLLTGVAPAAYAQVRDLTSSLKSGSRDGVLHRSRLRTTLLVVQTALSVVLLVGAGLFVRSLQNIHGLDYGFDRDRVALVDANIPDGVAGDARAAIWDRLLEQARSLPGVDHAALAVTAPFWSLVSATVHVPGRDSIPQTASGRPYRNSVTPDFFATMGTRLVAGRVFTSADGPTAARVAIVNQTFAHVVWPNENAIGKCIKIGRDSAPCSEVVGVVQDVKQHELRGEVAMQIYTPLAQWPGGMRVLMIRTRRNASASVDAMRRALASADPSVQFVSIRTLSERIDREARPWTLGATMFSIFGLLAMLTAAIGLYSVIAYGVTQRMHEFGVRAALGADDRSLITLVLGGGVRVACVGLAIGFALSLAASRFLDNLLFDVSRYDPTVFVGVSAALLASAVTASFLPAWRASRVDPATALRAD